jgi:hypothetical protein
MMTFKEIGLLLLFVAAWVGLNRWVLPWFGIPTCMSGRCGLDRPPAETENATRRARLGDPSREDSLPEGPEARPPGPPAAEEGMGS